MAEVPLTKANAAVLFIDLQNGPLGSIGSVSSATLRNQAATLARVAALFGLPVVLAAGTQPDPAGAIIDELRVDAPTAPLVRHSTPNAYATPAFAEAVAATGRRQFILAGIATDVGVLLTALGMLAAGHQVWVAADVTGAVTHEAAAVALARLRHASIVVSSWASLAAEMQGDFAAAQGPELLALLLPPAAHSPEERP